MCASVQRNTTSMCMRVCLCVSACRHRCSKMRVSQCIKVNKTMTLEISWGIFISTYCQKGMFSVCFYRLLMEEREERKWNTWYIHRKQQQQLKSFRSELLAETKLLTIHVVDLQPCQVLGSAVLWGRKKCWVMDGKISVVILQDGKSCLLNAGRRSKEDSKHHWLLSVFTGNGD